MSLNLLFAAKEESLYELLYLFMSDDDPDSCLILEEKKSTVNKKYKYMLVTSTYNIFICELIDQFLEKNKTSKTLLNLTSFKIIVPYFMVLHIIWCVILAKALITVFMYRILQLFLLDISRVCKQKHFAFV